MMHALPATVAPLLASHDQASDIGARSEQSSAMNSMAVSKHRGSHSTGKTKVRA
jgi:hypothetical protein